MLVMEKKKILIADDERHVADLLTEALAGEGYETFEVTQALRFFDSVVEHQPDLILLDLLMPYLDGEDELRILSMNEQTKHIPVIVVTAVPDARQLMGKLKPFGVVEIVQKPFNLDDLLKSVQRNLK
jgi:CheY-like chemotaxis protein